MDWEMCVCSSIRQITLKLEVEVLCIAGLSTSQKFCIFIYEANNNSLLNIMYLFGTPFSSKIKEIDI